MTRHQMTDLLPFLIGHRSRRRLYSFTEVGQDSRVDGIGLSSLSDGPGKVTHLPRVDDRDC